MSSSESGAPRNTPFSLDSGDTYLRWRDQKLREYPRDASELIVEVDDPRRLTQTELAALRERCRRSNMAVYASQMGADPDPEIPLSVGRAFELEEITENWLADSTGITSLKVAKAGVRKKYIPYTTKAINWHTDGYYNAPNRQIRALIMHSVQDAQSGGENGLLDHEIAYLLLREKDPAYVEALMRPDAMTIPARFDDAGHVARPEERGAVFTVTSRGELHMRYTIRAKNVVWASDGETERARRYLQQLLEAGSEYAFRLTLASGMGLVSNNVLHDRRAFVDDPDRPRHYYRARYATRLRLDGESV